MSPSATSRARNTSTEGTTIYLPFDWRKIATIAATGVLAAAGAGAGAGASWTGADAVPEARMVELADSVAAVRAEPMTARLERLERASAVSSCVAVQQIKEQPLAGCAYLLEQATPQGGR